MSTRKSHLLAVVPKAHLLLFALLALSSCQRLPPGQVSEVGEPKPTARAGHVYLFRGFQDWYSDGIEKLTAELKTQGIDAEVFREEQYEDVARAIAKEQSNEPLVLIGFSYGADDAIEVGHTLEARHIPIDLLITIDPVTPNTMPSVVRKGVNFYQSNGVWDMLPFLRGIPVEPEQSSADLQNIRVNDRRDLVEPNTSHATIAANEKLHQEIIKLVLESCPPRGKTAQLSHNPK